MLTQTVFIQMFILSVLKTNFGFGKHFKNFPSVVTYKIVLKNTLSSYRKIISIEAI